MQNHAVELNNVIYNAASQSFEAKATVYAGASLRSFACAINAPIDMTFANAAQGLSTQALRGFQGNTRLFSSHPATTPAPQVRAGRASQRNVMDAFRMLRNLPT
jgi:hypothetical protein